MTDTDFAIKTRTVIPVADAEARVRDALAAEGFGVLTEIDVAETLQAKLGIEHAPYRILGACRPTLAHQALEVEPDVGLLLPRKRRSGCHGSWLPSPMFDERRARR